MTLKPVVFVPGFPATELWNTATGRMVFPPGPDDISTDSKRRKLIAQLCDTSTPLKLNPGQPIRRVFPIAKQAESLYELLRGHYGYTIESGDNFRAVGWDWRLAIDDADVQARIREAVHELKSRTGRRVVMLVHSTGGLVLRQLLESDATLAADIEEIVAFGVPWAGTLKAFRYLTRGEPIGFLFARLSASQTRQIMRCAQAAYDLCPIADPIALVVDPQRKPIAPMRTRSWMPANDSSVLSRATSADTRLGQRSRSWSFPAPVTNVVGFGVPTDVTCVVGSEVKFEESDQGDGTVALKSSAWIQGPGVRTLSIPIGAYSTNAIPQRHPRLWDSPPVLQILNEVLLDAPRVPFVAASVDNDDSLDPLSDVTVRVSASNAIGTALPDVRATLAFNGKSFEFDDTTRLAFRFRRSGKTKANFGSKFFRLRVDVTWNGGARELPLIIRV